MNNGSLMTKFETLLLSSVSWGARHAARVMLIFSLAALAGCGAGGIDQRDRATAETGRTVAGHPQGVAASASAETTGREVGWFMNPIAEGADPWTVHGEPITSRFRLKATAVWHCILSDRLTSLGEKHVIWKAPDQGPYSRKFGRRKFIFWTATGMSTSRLPTGKTKTT
jgi:hypothetical protein